jgi:hypothetical protein
MTIFVRFIHKKRHPKSYHSDMKLHMTQNIMFSVVFDIWQNSVCLGNKLPHALNVIINVVLIKGLDMTSSSSGSNP